MNRLGIHQEARMPRFALLEHDFPTLHWDFFLEAGDSLRSWRILHEPTPHQSFSTEAEAIADHRLLYLDYEGPVSGGRGHVRQIDAGTFEWLQDTPEALQVHLYGRQFQGGITLQESESGWRWKYEPNRDQ